MNGDPIARRAGTQSRISGPILRHTSGPSSQLSGPIAGFLPWIEEAKEAPRPPPPLPAGGLPVCTGPDFKKRKKIQQKDFFLCLFSILTLETTKTLVYALSNVAVDPSFRGLLSSF